jgi:glycosyltransferase involved in cell wall biosynthesis
MKSLYITHYGILEPLGQSQILPYLFGLAANGCSIQIISFEKPAFFQDRLRVEAQQKLLFSAGIHWFPRIYGRGNSLFQLLRSVLMTSAEISRRCGRDSIDLLHCRSHVPCLIALLASAWCGKPMLFDFRGFMAEEYVDAGLWKPAGFRFRATKALERILLKRCKALVVLTGPARDYLRQHYSLEPEKIFVIPCCADLSRYTPARNAELMSDNRPLRVVYSGSTAGRYNLLAMLSFFSLLRKKRPSSHFTILSTGDMAGVHAAVEQFHFPPEAVSILNVSHQEVPRHLAGQDLGLILLRGDLALKVASPTKVGEYLGSGLVVVAEEALGDMQEILVDSGAGCLMNSNNPETWEAVANAALSLCNQPNFRQKSRAVAQHYFDLNLGIQKYVEAYDFAVNARVSNTCQSSSPSN